MGMLRFPLGPTLAALVLSLPVAQASLPSGAGETLAQTPASSAVRASDPWPASEVLTRLFVLRPGDGVRLGRDLGLNAAQLAELRRLSRSERAYAAAARQVLGRGEATALNEKLVAMRLEKDRKVRLALGTQYPAFREWVRGWWASQVRGAQR